MFIVNPKLNFYLLLQKFIAPFILIIIELFKTWDNYPDKMPFEEIIPLNYPFFVLNLAPIFAYEFASYKS